MRREVEERPYRPLTEAMPKLGVLTSTDTGRDVSLLLREGPAGVTWDLDPYGRKPGHGLLVLRSARVGEGDRVADLCAGPLALFARYATQLGAAYAEAVEVDAELATNATKACQADPRVRVVHGDIAEVSRESPFDQVYVHPPMLPDSDTTFTGPGTRVVGWDVASRSKRYHTGGPTGRETLDRAVTVARDVLRPGGTVVIAQFEFLGVEVRFADQVPATFEVLAAAGFTPQEVHHYRVPLTEELHEHLDAIRATYPWYPLGASRQQDHRFSVVHATR